MTAQRKSKARFQSCRSGDLGNNDSNISDIRKNGRTQFDFKMIAPQLDAGCAVWLPLVRRGPRLSQALGLIALHAIWFIDKSMRNRRRGGDCDLGNLIFKCCILHSHENDQTIELKHVDFHLLGMTLWIMKVSVDRDLILDVFLDSVFSKYLKFYF